MQTVYWISTLALLIYFLVRVVLEYKKRNSFPAKKKTRIISMFFFLFLQFFIWGISLGITNLIFATSGAEKIAFLQKHLMDFVMAGTIGICFRHSVRTVKPVHRGIIIRLGARLEDVSEGPYLRFFWLDKIREFWMGQREFEIPDPNQERTGADIYTRDNKFVEAVIIVVWKVVNVQKFIEIVPEEKEEEQTIKALLSDIVMAGLRLYCSQFDMEKVLRDGKIAVKQLIMEGKYNDEDTKKPIDIGEGLKKLTKDQWGIEIVALSVKDIDPVNTIKSEMVAAAAALEQKKKTVTDAEADKQKRELGAVAGLIEAQKTAEGEKASGIAKAEALKINLEKQLEALQLTPQKFTDYLVAFEAAKGYGEGDKTVPVLLGGATNLLDLAQNIANSISGNTNGKTDNETLKQVLDALNKIVQTQQKGELKTASQIAMEKLSAKPEDEEPLEIH